MIGKKNLVFGFFYLVLTAALGPMMILQHFPAQADAESAKRVQLGKLQEAVGNDFLNDNLENMKPEEIAKNNARAVLSLSGRANADMPIALARNAHAHGNLEAMLNIAAGFLLCFVSISVRFKQIISWTFIAGAVLHSGLLYLAGGFQLDWALAILGTPVSSVGPVLVLAGLAMAGWAALIGFRGEIVRDW